MEERLVRTFYPVNGYNAGNNRRFDDFDFATYIGHMDEVAVLEHAVKVIFELAKPIRIVLFGSRARGESTSDSDIDLLVIVPDGTARDETRFAIRRTLISP